MHVEIWSDIACPWCYVGKRRFEAALAAFEHADEVTVTWRSFELDPGAPPERPEDAAGHLAKKYGRTREQAEQMHAAMTEMAAGEGLDFRFDRLRLGNTFDAHRLVHLGAAHGIQDAVKERLFRGYLSEGELMSDPETLRRLGAEAGLPADEVADLLASDRFAAEVREDERTGSSLGISAVPFFVADRAFGASGAQPAEVLLEFLRQAWERRPPSRRRGRRGLRSRQPLLGEWELDLAHAVRPGRVLGDAREAALLEHAHRSEVGGRDVRDQRSDGVDLQELAQRARGDPGAPELAADPVADQAPAVGDEALDVAGHRAVDLDRAQHDRLVAADPRPVGVERLAVARHERGHRRSLGVGLVGEEHLQVPVANLTQHRPNIKGSGPHTPHVGCADLTPLGTGTGRPLGRPVLRRTPVVRGYRLSLSVWRAVALRPSAALATIVSASFAAFARRSFLAAFLVTLKRSVLDVTPLAFALATVVRPLASLPVRVHAREHVDLHGRPFETSLRRLVLAALMLRPSAPGPVEPEPPALPPLDAGAPSAGPGKVSPS